MMKKIKIGAVSLTIEAGATSGTKATDQGEKDYSDGGVEDFLLKLFRSKNPHKKVEDILRNNPSWPQLYHLSFARHNLLNWYPFKQTDSVLEIGAGCGALTGLFTASCGHVTALELTKRRATIIAERFRDAKNLDVVIANIMNWRTEKKYDYVIISGVLEYSGQFVDDETPYESFLKKAASYLKPDGCLILAIENKLGLKYWAGSREDHTWHFFDSIEDYPRQATKVRTFSRHELVELLSGVGLPNQNFYYPVPDMKLSLIHI